MKISGIFLTACIAILAAGPALAQDEPAYSRAYSGSSSATR
jgi:hypothetical protein